MHEYTCKLMPYRTPGHLNADNRGGWRGKAENNRLVDQSSPGREREGWPENRRLYNGAMLNPG